MRVLIVAAHPDDIEPEMGGTIYRYTSKGHQVLMMTMTLPEDDHNGDKINGAKQKRREEAEEAAKILGAQTVILDEDRKTFASDPRALTKVIDKVYREFWPDIVYTCCEDDSHSDHVAVSRAVRGTTRDNQTGLYIFQPIIPGGLLPQKFQAHVFSLFNQEHMDKKLESIRCYESQIVRGQRYSEANWIGAVIARDKMFGAQLGGEYAEAFQILRGKLHIHND
jgi:N-acetylglucosamine malate deacetylase 1